MFSSHDLTDFEGGKMALTEGCNRILIPFFRLFWAMKFAFSQAKSLADNPWTITAHLMMTGEGNKEEKIATNINIILLTVAKCHQTHLFLQTINN